MVLAVFISRSMPDKEQQKSQHRNTGEEQSREDAEEEGRGNRGNGTGWPFRRKRRIQNAGSGEFARRAAAAGGGGLRVKFVVVFGEVVRHGRKCYSVTEKLSRRGGRQ